MSSIFAPSSTPRVSLHGETSKERVIERWHAFFKTDVPNMSEEKKGLVAMAKLTQVALVNYIRYRKIYQGNVFVKRRFEKVVFYTLNEKQERGEKLNKIVRSIGAFIKLGALKGLRFQLFHNPEKPDEVGEELQFQFYYGRKQRVELDFGHGKKLDLDMTDCNFENFLRMFAEILARINAYCEHLSPFPTPCEKRFRTSFCKKIPQDFDTGLFDATSNRFYYPPNMNVENIGTAKAREVGLGSILRTCYLSEEAQNLIEEQLANAIQTQISSILGDQGNNEEVVEVARRERNLAEEHMLNSSVAGSEFQPVHHAEIPIQDEQRTVVLEPQEAVMDSTINILQSPIPTDSESIVSMEAVLSPYVRNVSVHEITRVNETTRDSSHDDSGNNSKNDDDDNAGKKKPSPKKQDSNQERPRRTTRKTAPTSYAEEDSDDRPSTSDSEEDAHKNRRKKAPIKRKSNRSVIEEASQKAAAKRPRRTVK